MKAYSLLFAFLSILVTACASTGPQLSADQLKAVPAGGAICSSVTGVWGTAKVVYVNVERGIIPNGGVNVSPDCLVQMNIAAVPRAPAVEPAPVPAPKAAP